MDVRQKRNEKELGLGHPDERKGHGGRERAERREGQAAATELVIDHSLTAFELRLDSLDDSEIV